MSTLTVYIPGNRHRVSCVCFFVCFFNIDGLVQERRNSIALAMELHLSCTKPLINGLVLQERCNSSGLAIELHLSCTNRWVIAARKM